MKNRLMLPILLLLFALTLTACVRYPERADDGTAWSEDWEMLGSAMGVEAPQHDLALLDNAVVLAADDTYYATWAVGEGSPYTNADGAETTLYPAQLYLLLYGCADEAKAADAAADWLARERENYNITAERTETRNGQDYAVLVYDVDSASNPYARGAAAFGVFGRYAVSAEFTCTAEYDGDAEAVLSDFLDGCHYSAAAIR